jgi:hypothetical protein
MTAFTLDQWNGLDFAARAVIVAAGMADGSKRFNTCPLG